MVTAWIGNRFDGESTDQKPINAESGSVFFEKDTGLVYYKLVSWQLSSGGNTTLTVNNVGMTGAVGFSGVSGVTVSGSGSTIIVGIPPFITGAHITGSNALTGKISFTGVGNTTTFLLGDNVHVSGINNYFKNVEEMVNYPPHPNYTRQFHLLGYYDSGDGGDSLVYWNPNDTRTENSGTIFQSKKTSDGRWNRPKTNIFNIKQFGARGNSSSDDYILIKNASDAAPTEGVLYFPPGYDFRLNTPILISGNIRGEGAIISTTYTGGPLVTYGGRSAYSKKFAHFPKINQESAFSWSGSDVGLLLLNTQTCELHIPAVQLFSEGVKVYGSGAGNVHNNIFLGELNNNKIQLKLDATAGGWSNENNYFGGRFTFASNYGTGYTGTRQILISNPVNSVNNNRFYGCSLETDPPEYHVECRGQHNFFDRCRWETSNVTTVPPKMLYSGTAAIKNLISYGYSSEFIQITETGGLSSTADNHIYTSRFAKLTTAGSIGALQLHCASTTQPSLAIFDGSTGIHNQTYNNDYCVSIGADRLMLKSKGNSDPIVKFDYSSSANNRIIIKDNNRTAIYISGNTGAASPFTAATLVLDSNIDFRGRGMLLPHSDSTDRGSENNWYVGVPYLGGAFQVGNSVTPLLENATGAYTTGQSKLTILENGNIGIGVPAPSAKLDISGKIRIRDGGPSGDYILTSTDGLGNALWLPNYKEGVFLDQYNPPDFPNNTYSQFQRAISDAQTGNRTLILSPRQYYTTGILNVSGLRIIGRGATISGNGSGYVFSAAGSIGSYFNLGANANSGQNYAVCTGLTGSLNRGDLVKIISNADFSSDASRPQGEMHLVESVSGDSVLFNNVLFDTYLTGQTGKMAKVSPTTFYLDNNITIKQTEYNSANSPTPRGVFCQFGFKPIIGGNYINCQEAAVRVEDCYAPVIDASCNSNWYVGGGTNYGVNLSNATMFARVMGTYQGCRHAVSIGGNSAGGVVWEAHLDKIIGTTHPTSTQSVFDAHASVGSVTYENCTAISAHGLHAGFALYGRKNKILNCRTYNCNDGYAMSDVDVTIDYLIIDGLEIFHPSPSSSVYGVYISAGKVNHLYINNLISHAKFGAIRINDRIEDWKFSNIRNYNGYLFYSHTTVTGGMVPELLQLDNCINELPAPDSTYLNVYLADDSAIKHVRLNNIRQKNSRHLFRSLNSISTFEAINCYSDTPVNDHILFSSSCDTAKVIGGFYGNPTTSSSYLVKTSNTLDNLSLVGVTTTGSNLAAITNGTINYIQHQGNNFHTSTLFNGNPTEIVAGSYNKPAWNRTSSSNLFLGNSGNIVGIGTNIPGCKLQVGTGSFGAFSTTVDTAIQTSTTTDSAEVANVLFVNDSFNNRRTKWFLNDSTSKAGFDITWNATGVDFVIQRAGVDIFNITTQAGTNNVGIGNTSPAQKLSVNGSVLVSGNIIVGGPLDTDSPSSLRYRNRADLGVFESGYGLQIQAPERVIVSIDSNNNNENSSFAIVHDTTTGYQSTSNSLISAKTLFVVNEGGEVGIGTTSPTSNLDITGQVRIRGGNPTVSGILFCDSNGVGVWNSPNFYPSGQNPSGYLIQSNLPTNIITGSGTANYITKFSTSSGITNSRIYDDGTNIGIGLTNPNSRLHITGNYGSFVELLKEEGGQQAFTLKVFDDTVSKQGAFSTISALPGDEGIFLESNFTSGSTSIQVLNKDIIIGLNSQQSGNMFRVVKGGLSFIHVNVDSEKIGIGTSSPLATLHSSGDILGQKQIIKKTGAYNITTGNSRVIFTNQGATGEVKFQLPNANEGLDYGFMVHHASGIRVQSTGFSTIRVGTSVTANNGYAISSGVGSSLRIIGINTGEWFAESNVGSWTLV